MSINVLDYINKLESIDVERMTAEIVKLNEEEIIEVNKKALDKGKNYDNQIVGVYDASTELISKNPKNIPNKSKVTGNPYNFDWTGQLLDGIFITYGKFKINFDSKGKGDAKKRLFVDSNKLLGATDKGAKFINFKIILPDLLKDIKQVLSRNG